MGKSVIFALLLLYGASVSCEESTNDARNGSIILSTMMNRTGTQSEATADASMITTDPDVFDLSHLKDYYRRPSKLTGELVKNWDAKTSKINPEEFDNDAIYPFPLRRNAFSAKSYKWPNATVPYELNGNFSRD